MRKGAIIVITAISVTTGTLLVVTIKTTATSGKEAITVIAAIFIIAGTPLATTAEIAAISGTRLD